jgi:hypothetical protein
MLRSVLDRLTRQWNCRSRFGMVASATMEDAQIPPGLTALIAHLGRPWGGLRTFQGRFLAQIAWPTRTMIDATPITLTEQANGRDKQDQVAARC